MRTTGLTAIALLLGNILVAQPYGITERVPNTQLRIMALPGGGDGSIPERLSDLPALQLAGRGEGHTVSGLVPYRPASPLWSDASGKERYVALPDYAFDGPTYAQVEYRKAGAWEFPEHTVVVKNFVLSLDERDPDSSEKRIETRLLFKHEGVWHGFSYEWDDDETDAVLVDTAGKTRPMTLVDAAGDEIAYNWEYPSRQACQECHTQGANFLLGLQTPQINHEFTYPGSGVRDNQLRTLSHLQIFSNPPAEPPEDLPRMPEPTDGEVSLDQRARSYLAANCGNCHHPGAPIVAEVDFTWEADRAGLRAIGWTPLRDTAGLPPEAEIVFPGEPDLSVLLARVESLDPVVRMPPLASMRVDTSGTALLRSWIESLPAKFLRGDCDGDGTASGSVGDAIFLLRYNFAGETRPGCLAACDANGDGVVEGQVTDAVYLLHFSFLGGAPPIGPFPTCGASALPTDDDLGCAADGTACP